MRHVLTLVLGIMIGAGGFFGVEFLRSAHNTSQPYAGEDQRQVTSLSPEDIRQLQEGAGWGLAKPAELNGYPGPAHVLEFADELELSDDQKNQIRKAFETMNAKARDLGVALIEAEAALDSVFSDQTATPDLLMEKLRLTEDIRTALRAVHLSAHLEITPLLSDDQKEQYASLRGYGSGHAAHAGH